MLKFVSLFSGAGGLDLGLEAAGFIPRLCVENDKVCRQTLQANRAGWPLSDPSDIFALDALTALKQASVRRRELDLLAGGPPCQPFSKAGYWATGKSLRLRDPRAKTLNAYTKLVEAFLPKVILLENVEGIKFNKMDEGFRLLERHLKAINRRCGTRYRPVSFSLNAADFGVPQLRKRIFLVAARSGQEFRPPLPTHGSAQNPHVTTWEAIGDLEQSLADEALVPRGTWTQLLGSIPEGANYLWHTDRGGGRPIFGFRTRYWSFLLKLSRSKPSWTIPAQPGPSTGPFHWNNRLLSARELARLQTFPDSYAIMGGRLAIQKQLGNAVPPLLAEVLGREIATQLLGVKREWPRPTYQVRRHTHTLPATIICDVPSKFLRFVGKHPAHPGTGKGPGATQRKTEALAKEDGTKVQRTDRNRRRGSVARPKKPSGSPR